MTLRVTRQYNETALQTERIISLHCPSATDSGYATSAGGFATGNMFVGISGGIQRHGFVRFTNVDIPPGSEILDAYLWYSSADNTTAHQQRIYGVVGEQVVSPTDYDEFIALEKTEAFVNDNPPVWSSVLLGFRTENIATIISELTKKNTWRNNHPLLFILNNNGTVGQRYIPNENLYLVVQFIPPKECSSTITIGQFALTAVPFKGLDATVSIVSDAESSIKALSASSIIDITDTIYVPWLIDVFATSTISINAVPTFTQLHNIHPCFSSISLGSVADYWIHDQWFRGRDIGEDIELLTTASIEFNKWGSATDSLILTAIAGHSGSVTYYCSNDLTSSYTYMDGNGKFFEHHYRLGEYATVISDRIKDNHDKIKILSSAEVILVQAIGSDVGCESTIELTDSTVLDNATAFATEIIEMVSEAAVASSKRFGESLTVSAIASVQLFIDPKPSSDIKITDSVAYELVDLKGNLCSYSMFTGNSSVPSLAPVIIRGSGITLEYDTTVLTLKSPDFGNRDSLSFNRINRVSRGGTLQVYADPQWPRTQLMSIDFLGLTEEEGQSVLSFVEESLGKDIKITDWEGRSWTGVITNPETALVRVGITGNMLSLEIEIHGMLFGDIIETLSIDASSDGAFVYAGDCQLPIELTVDSGGEVE